MSGKVGGLSPPYFKNRGAIAPLAPLLPPPLDIVIMDIVIMDIVILDIVILDIVIMDTVILDMVIFDHKPRVPTIITISNMYIVYNHRLLINLH